MNKASIHPGSTVLALPRVLSRTLVVPGLVALAPALAPASLSAAPCSPEELALHKTAGQLGLLAHGCAQAAPWHQLPEPQAPVGHINLTSGSLNVGGTCLPPEGDGSEEMSSEDPEFASLVVLSRGTCAWINPAATRTYDLVIRADRLGTEFSYAGKMRSRAVRGPAR